MSAGRRDVEPRRWLLRVGSVLMTGLLAVFSTPAFAQADRDSKPPGRERVEPAGEQRAAVSSGRTGRSDERRASPEDVARMRAEAARAARMSAAADGLADLEALISSHGSMGNANSTLIPGSVRGSSHVDERAGVPVYLIRANELGAYGGGSPVGLLHDAGQRVYPVVGSAGPVTAMFLSGQDDAWRPSAFTNKPIAVAIQRAFAATPPQERAAFSSGYAIVRLRSLAVDFLARRTSSGWRLAPVNDNADYGLVAGREEDAETLLARLAPLALAATAPARPRPR